MSYYHYKEHNNDKYDKYDQYDVYLDHAEPNHCEYKDSDPQYHNDTDHKDIPEGLKHGHQELEHKGDRVRKLEELKYGGDEVQELEEPVYDDDGTEMDWEGGCGEEIKEYKHGDIEYKRIEACEYEELVCKPNYNPENDHVAYKPHRFNYDDEQMDEYIYTPLNTFSTPTHLPGMHNIPLSIQHGHMTMLKHMQDAHRFAHTDYNTHEHACAGYDTAEPTPTLPAFHLHTHPSRVQFPPFEPRRSCDHVAKLRVHIQR
jgi:hypothetical protein